MARKHIIRQSTFPYHVTSRSNNKEWFNLPLTKVWTIVKEALIYANNKFPVELHSFVLMNNHYHMILSTPKANIDSFMQAFNKTYSEKLRIATGRINRMFGGPYKWSIIDTRSYLYNVHRYVYQNPIRSNSATACEEYPYSTLYYEAKQKPFSLPITTILDEECH